MNITNFEFKAATNDPERLEKILLTLNPVFAGEDHQTDTYFNVREGRLKLREGNIENALIYYRRPDISGFKQSDIIIYRHNPEKSLKEILSAALGIKVQVEKSRKIYFIDNVKFHFDTVKGLGTFVEVEAIDTDGSIGTEKLKEQCERFARIFNIAATDFISKSYSDMIIGKQ